MADQGIAQLERTKPLPAHYGRPRRKKAPAWSVKSLLAKTIEERGKYSQEAWQELEVEIRNELRAAMRGKGTDKKSSREIKDIALAAGICQSKAYPDQAHNGLGAHVPALLLQVAADRILKGCPIPVDITPEPQAEVQAAPCLEKTQV